MSLTGISIFLLWTRDDMAQRVGKVGSYRSLSRTFRGGDDGVVRGHDRAAAATPPVPHTRCG